jgi:hypothetical protein
LIAFPLCDVDFGVTPPMLAIILFLLVIWLL